MRPRARHTMKGGVAKIRRDSYGPKWYQAVNDIQKRDEYKCMACGAMKGTLNSNGAKVKLDTHHAKPLSRGGTTTKANLITLCETCHARRHSHL